MDERLSEAARTGNVTLLHQLLFENPLILADCMLFSPQENPLHIAAKAGQLAFVQQVLAQRPDFARQLNADGFRPLDIASAIGYVEIVNEIIKTCPPDVCRLKGRAGRTCFHYATMNERVEIIDGLLNSCGESIKDVTSLGESALHLALKYHKLEAFTNLIRWLERLGLEELVNWADKDGNTILHLAVSRKQLESVELLLSSNSISSILELNARNSRGLTAMDLLDNTPIDNPNDDRLKEILRCAGALVVETPRHTLSNNPNPSKDWIKYFQFQTERDSPSDTRNALLVVAALIATVTFQAGMNPPSKFLPDITTDTTNSAPPPASALGPEYPTVTSGLVFVFANTLSLAASMQIIDFLTNRFPFQRELQVAMFSMMFTYSFALPNVKPAGARKDVMLGIAFSLPFLLRYIPRWVRKFASGCNTIRRRDQNNSIAAERQRNSLSQPA